MKDLSYDTLPAEIRTANFPKTSQKLYCVKKFSLRDNIKADFKEEEWENMGWNYVTQKNGSR
jgi:hypothetical protein